MQWQNRKPFFWETAPFFRLLLPLIAGILAYQYVHFSINELRLPLVITISISFSLFTTASFIRNNTTLIHTSRLGLAFTSLTLIAWLLCYYADIRNDKLWFGHTIDRSEAYVVRVNNDPEPKERTYKISVSVLYSLSGQKISPSKGQALMYVYKSAYPFYYNQGDTIIVPNKWERIRNSGNPFEFDYAGYCAKNNLYYRQFLAPSEIKRFARSTAAGRSYTENAHRWCMQQLQTYLKDSATLGLIQAMLLGDETNLDDHLLQAYSDTGIVHIIAISGGNVAIFFLIIAFLLSWLKNKKYTWLKYFISLPIVWFYVLMAGAPPSAIRAAIMFSILAVGYALQKPQNSLNFLFAAAFILLCAQPMWLFSVGFQLSFIAVLSLILFYKPIYSFYSPTNFITKGLWSTIVASIAAEMLVAPLVIYYFHLFPLLFIVANVLAYLFMGLVLILGMSIVALSFIPIIANIIGWLTAFIVTYFNSIVYYLQQLNPKAFHYLNLTSAELLIIYVMIAGIASFLLNKNKVALFISITATCLLLLSFCRNEWSVTYQQKLVVYNCSGSTYIEFIDHKKYMVLRTDTGIKENKLAYITNPAHTAWHAWHQTPSIPNDLFTVNNKTFLILDSFNNAITTKIPVDNLIITYKSSQQAIQIIETFNPKKIILSSAIHKDEALKWANIARLYHIQLHTVAIDGAYIGE